VLRHADDVKGQAASGSNREGESTEARRRGGAARSSVEGPVMGLERRGCVVRPWPRANWKREEPVDEAKPFTTAEHREPCDSRGSCTVVCPVKAGMFSREQTCRGRSQSPVVWIAEEMETEPSKPIDKTSSREVTSHRAVTTVNALWPRK
jgi:NAD-dependent dihydropyrimidine dehydrogenase PreA subunit